jgi:hypothetical protein
MKPASSEIQTTKKNTPSDSEIWDELLNSEASQRFLEEEVKKAKELLGEDPA